MTAGGLFADTGINEVMMNDSNEIKLKMINMSQVKKDRQLTA